jgi:gas vesicle protein
MTDNNGMSGFGLGLLVGAVAGLAVGFLYAPKSGRDMRALIKEKGEEAWDKADDIVKEAEARAKRIIDDARGKAAQMQGKD